MPALPSDYYLLSSSNQAHPITGISSAFYLDDRDPHQPSPPPATAENLNQDASFNSLGKEDLFHRQVAAELRHQSESLSQSNFNFIPHYDVDSTTTADDGGAWPSHLALESHGHLSPTQDSREDFYQDLDHLGILDYLRSDQEFQTDDPEKQFNPSGLDWLESQTDRHEIDARNLNRGVPDAIFGSHQHSAPENQERRLLSCSSCGVTKPQDELSRIWPCYHPHCNTCINTLINASCNDPPPPQMVCFFCSRQVDGFDPPSSFLSGQSSQMLNKFPLRRFPSIGNQKSFLRADLDGIASVNFTSPPSDQSGFYTGSFSSLWSPNPNSEAEKLLSSWMTDDYIPFQGATGNSCPWPIVRVDNISWSLKVADIVSWLPGGKECLPPHELCPLPIHILCTPTDGKTLNHCFIEMRNLTAAHFIVRHRHGSKIGNRPCSVVLTSPVELHSKILGIKEKETPPDIMRTVRLLLKLCAPHTTSSIKSPERPFYHLMAILSHCGHMSEGGMKAEDSGQVEVLEKWTHIHQIAIESLFGWKIDKADSMNILHCMVDVAISSSLVDKPTLFRFLSQF